MTEDRVTLASVGKSYGGRPALADLDLALGPGDCVALVGHNGAGKSTIIKLILGLIRPSAGRVGVLGVDPSGRAAATVRGRMGYVPEHLSLHPALTGAETLAFYARLKRQPRALNAALLERVGIAEAADRRVSTYSNGMRQRLGLAQALLGAPTLLLLDEPTTGLDPALRASFYEIVRDLKEGGATILIASHALAELQDHVDRVVIMNRGRKVAEGSVAELRRRAAQPIRIRLTLPDAALAPLPALTGARVAWRKISETVIEGTCQAADKMQVVEALCPTVARFADIEIIAPSLDDTYAHFLQREAAE